MKRAIPFLAGLALAVGFFGAVPAQAEDTTFDYENDIEPILADQCFGCHGKRRQNGELNLEEMAQVLPLVKNRDKWINVLERVKRREMPPEDSKRTPTKRDYKDLESWLDQSIHQYDYSHVKNPGYETARRLSHYEYDNTMRDLFGIDIKPGRKFPSDLSGVSGFENSANTLFMQPILMERYIGAAEEVIEAALPAERTTQDHLNSYSMIFVATPGEGLSEDQAARKVLEHFLSRAYRRPAMTTEIDESFNRYQVARQQGADFEGAIKRVLKIILIDPMFLMKIEQKPDTADDYRITSYELASRLSYFLWGSMPDDTLFNLAESNELREPKIMSAQVARMMADDKARVLGNTFAAQWLGSDALGVRIRLDPIDNPWCTDSLMDSMKAETALFFDSLIQENQPVSRLVDANYTYLNEELANHYELEGIEGSEMRRVDLDNPNRGGIFGQGSLMAVTSLGRRTSPVIRGNWILSEILGTPPPPPPPDAGELSSEIRRNRKLTQKEKLALHSESPRCAGCHSEMDPLGLSLENFDFFGRWRTKAGRRGGEIDSTGQLPGGSTFTGPAGLKQVIVEEKLDELVRQLSKKMLSFALGRQLEWYDEPAIRELTTAMAENDNRFQTLIFAIANSYPFQHKRVPMEDTEGETQVALAGDIE
jgi:hypothetical protein